MSTTKYLTHFPYGAAAPAKANKKMSVPAVIVLKIHFIN